MKVSECIDGCLDEGLASFSDRQPDSVLRVFKTEPETRWHKLDHLLYLPILGLSRPRDLYYYQGKGLNVLYDFTYKYLSLEHFLGELRQLGVGFGLTNELCCTYSKAWFPGEAPLFIYSDWHSKAHWTKMAAHSGQISMLGRFMPGTRQLMINGPQGHLLGGWNHPIDTHLSRVLVDLEADLDTRLQRSISYNIFDSEGSGLPTAERYVEAKRHYISALPRKSTHLLENFELIDDWEGVDTDEKHEVIEARWKDAKKAQADPRRLILMRPVGGDEPTRIYAGCIPEDISIAAIPGIYRQRWPHQEGVIRQLVNGANLNSNYGYSFKMVENRTQKRRWEEAQKKVEISEERLSLECEALGNLWQKLKGLRRKVAEKKAQLQKRINAYRSELRKRKKDGKPHQRCCGSLKKCEQKLAEADSSFQERRHKLLKKICQRRQKRSNFQKQLQERQKLRDEIDTETLCRERDVEKDQIMFCLQILLFNLHKWVCTHFLAPQWQNLELNTATELIYRKPGKVKWTEEEIEMTLDAYRYTEHQKAMEESCRRFNEAQLRWRDGRLLRMRVAPP